MDYFVLIGWAGALFYILGYFLLSIDYLKSDGTTFHVLNILGGVCLVVYAVFTKDVPNFFVNALWALIGVYSVINNTRIIRKSG